MEQAGGRGSADSAFPVLSGAGAQSAGEGEPERDTPTTSPQQGAGRERPLRFPGGTLHLPAAGAPAARGARPLGRRLGSPFLPVTASRPRSGAHVSLLFCKARENVPFPGRFPAPERRREPEEETSSPPSSSQPLLSLPRGGLPSAQPGTWHCPGSPLGGGGGQYHSALPTRKLSPSERRGGAA